MTHASGQSVQGLNPKVRFFAQKEKRPAGIARQSMELYGRLKGRIDVVPEFRRRGFELRLNGHGFGGYLSLIASQSVPYRAYRGEISHAADYGIAPYFGDRFDIITFYDPYPWEHLDAHQPTGREALRISLFVPVILNARKIVVATKYGRARVKSLFNRDAIIIPCGISVDNPWFRRDVEPMPITALTVGADHPRKNLDLVIEACAIAGFRLITVGNWNWPGSEAHAKRLAKSLDVTLLDYGYVPDDELARLYSACVHVTASMDEGFGLTPLEALACGGRVAASDIPAHVENMRGEAQYFDFKDVNDLVGAMQQAENDHDYETKVEQAKRFAWPNIVPIWLRLYKEAWRDRYA